MLPGTSNPSDGGDVGPNLGEVSHTIWDFSQPVRDSGERQCRGYNQFDFTVLEGQRQLSRLRDTMASTAEGEWSIETE